MFKKAVIGLIFVLSGLLFAKDLLVNGPLFVGNTANKRFAIIKVETDFDTLKVYGNELYSFERIADRKFELVIFSGHTKLTLSAGIHGKHLLEFDAFPEKEYYMKLTKNEEKKYNVKIISNVDSAAVIVDGNLLSFTPSTLELLSRNYILRLEKKGFLPSEKQFSVENDTIITVNMEENYAWLEVKGIADSVHVFLDNKFLGYAPLKQKISLSDHNLVLKRNAFYLFNHQFSSESGQTYPQTADYEMIQLNVETLPVKASVYIDNFFAGMADGTFLINKGLHEVKLLHTDYQDVVITEDLQEDKKLQIRLKKKFGISKHN